MRKKVGQTKSPEGSCRFPKKLIKKTIEPPGLGFVMLIHQLALFFAGLDAKFPIGSALTDLPSPESFNRHFWVKLKAIDIFPVTKGLVFEVLITGQSNSTFW